MKSKKLILVVFILLLFFLTKSLIAQNAEFYEKFSLCRKNVGGPIKNTGKIQEPPKIVNVSTIACDVLCIEIDECEIIPAIQIPYQQDSTDLFCVVHSSSLGEDNAIRVVRNGYPLGLIVGPDRNTLTIFERITGKHLNTAEADNPLNYKIFSNEDINYLQKVSPKCVWRKSKPINYTEENRHFGEYYSAKHFMYLKLPHPLKNGMKYLISLPALELDKTAFYYVNDPLFVRSEAIHSSQIGFRPDDTFKRAYLSSWMGNGGSYFYPQGLEFFIVDEMTNQIVYKGTTLLLWNKDSIENIGTRVNHTQANVYSLDFSDFRTPGKYRVCVEGIGCGYPFYIDTTNTWRNAFFISMKGYFNQRSGIPLLPPYTDFVRPRSFHTQDGVKVYQSKCSLLFSGNGLNAFGTDKDNFGNLVNERTDELMNEAWGGRMDAGDWDRRIQHLHGTRLLLELIEMYPEYFKNVYLNIPESSNNLPDLLDEALYDLDIYRRMQTSDGGIRGGVESSEHPAEGACSWQESLTVYAYAPDPWSTYIYAGVAARAAHVLKLLNMNDLAVLWENSALKAINWAEDEYKKCDFLIASKNVKKEITIERNLASIELYRITKEKGWHKLFLSTLKSLETERTEALFIYSILEKSMVDTLTQRKVKNYLIQKADKLLNIASKNAYGITTNVSGGPLGGWEATYSIPASPTLVRAHFLTKENKYLSAVLRSSLFSAGANPMNLVLTTGLGYNCVKHPLHEDSRHSGQSAPIGITVNGPCEIPYYAKPGSDMRERLDRECTPKGSEWPTAESYFDVYVWDIQNEYVVNRNIAQSAYVWGYLAAYK